MNDLIARVWSFLTRDLVSSLAHGLVAVVAVLAVHFWGVWAAYWCVVAFYAVREFNDLRKHWREEGAFTAGFKVWVGDGWLDFMAPVVLGAFTAMILT